MVLTRSFEPCRVEFLLWVSKEEETISKRRRIFKVVNRRTANGGINKKLTSCFRNGVVFIGDLIDRERSRQPRIRSRRPSLKIPVPSSASYGPCKPLLKVSTESSDRIGRHATKRRKVSEGQRLSRRRKKELRVLLDSLPGYLRFRTEISISSLRINETYQ